MNTHGWEPGGRRLRQLAETRGLLVGFAARNDFWDLEREYRDTAAREFNILTPENQMKWQALRPTAVDFNFEAADRHVAFAEAHGMVVHGHTLAWHIQNPDWLTQGTFDRDQLIAVLRHHMATVVGRYRGRIAIWDVVNEALADDGEYRRTVWQTGIGPDYIEMAFRLAHEADPACTLVYNDYGQEAINRKSDAMFKLVGELLQRGVPIHGVGFQMHRALNDVDLDSFAANLARFAALGLKLYITELDIRLSANTGANLAEQAEMYGRILRVCRRQPACKAVQIWGMTDKHSWIPSWFPGSGWGLPFDDTYAPKPAYYALQAALMEDDPQAPAGRLAEIADEAYGHSIECLTGKAYADFILGALRRRMKPESLRGSGRECLNWVDSQFARCPPEGGPERRIERDRLFAALDVASLICLDQGLGPLRALIAAKTRQVVNGLKESTPAEGIRFHQLYNEGLIVQTPTACIGLDIVLPEQDGDLAGLLAERLDMLFVSHEHSDHYAPDSPLMQHLKERRKPVVFPPENQPVAIGVVLGQGTVKGVEWSAFRGAHVQETVGSHYYLLKLGGFKILFSGDNTRWLPLVESGEARDVDVFLYKPEALHVGQAGAMNDILAAHRELFSRFRPRRIVLHHLLEIGHGDGAYAHGLAMCVNAAVPGRDMLRLHWGETLSIPSVNIQHSQPRLLCPLHADLPAAETFK